MPNNAPLSTRWSGPLLVALLVTRADAAPQSSADAEADQPLLERSQLSGDWSARSALAADGITFDIYLTNFFQGVASGGRHRDFAVGGNFEILLNADLGQMKLVPGGSLLVHGESRYGETVNEDSGAFTPVNTRGYFPLTSPINEAVPFAVTELSYSQSIGEWLDFTIGKMIVVDGDPVEFGGGRGRTQFFNSNFIYNAVTSQTAPYAALGAEVDVTPASWITISNAVFETTDASTTSGFDTLNDGLTWWSQISTQYSLGTLPGGFNVGALYAFDNSFTRIGGTATIVPGGVQLQTVSDSWSVFMGTWQYLYAPDAATAELDPSDGHADLRGIGLFARLGFADPDANPVDWSASIGVGGRGMIPGRDNDTFGLAYYYTDVETTRLTSLFDLKSSTQGVEAYYDIVLTPAINLTFDVQWIDGIVRRDDSALVLGMRLGVTF